MNPQVTRHSPAWVVFTYVSFLAAVGMIGSGIVFAPVDLALKAYFAMGMLMLIQSCITMTKTMRDVEEGAKLVNRLEEAKAERLLMEIDRGKE